MSGREIVDRGEPVEGPRRFRCDTTLLERLIECRPHYAIEAEGRKTFELMKSWTRT